MSSIYILPALRQLVYQRAGGCCEYCLIPETVTFAGHEIDHIIAQKHGGSTAADNLALACVLCNKHKGSDITSLDPATGAIVPLFHPRLDRWGEHFQLNGAQLIPLTPTGRATVRLLQLNHPNRFVERERLLVIGILRVPN
jgi:hypothetical protein